MINKNLSFNKEAISGTMIIFILLTLMLAESFPIFLETSSYALGLGISLNIFIVFLFYLSSYLDIKIKNSYVLSCFVIIFFIFFHFLLSLFMFNHLNYKKFIFSLFFLFVVLMLSAFFCEIVLKVKEKGIDQLMIFVFWILVQIGVCATILMIFNVKLYSSDSKFMILFTEPSHYALVLLPFLFYKTYLDKKIFNFGFFLILFIIFGAKNLTLLAGVLLVLITVIPLRKFILFILITLAFIVLLHSYIHLNYFINRITFNFRTSDSSLTVLAYLSGFERAWLSLIHSYGWGVGFQQFGYVGPMGYYHHVLVQMGMGKLNLHDGTFIGAKVIAEFGIFGIFLLVLYVILWVQYLLKIKKINNINKHELFFISFFYMYFIDLFIRGTNYFDFSSLLFFSSIWFLIRANNFIGWVRFIRGSKISRLLIG